MLLVSCIESFTHNKQTHTTGSGEKASQTLSRFWEDVVKEVAVHYERILVNKQTRVKKLIA